MSHRVAGIFLPGRRSTRPKFVLSAVRIAVRLYYSALELWPTQEYTPKVMCRCVSFEGAYIRELPLDSEGTCCYFIMFSWSQDWSACFETFLLRCTRRYQNSSRTPPVTRRDQSSLAPLVQEVMTQSRSWRIHLISLMSNSTSMALILDKSSRTKNMTRPASWQHMLVLLTAGFPAVNVSRPRNRTSGVNVTLSMEWAGFSGPSSTCSHSVVETTLCTSAWPLHRLGDSYFEANFL